MIGDDFTRERSFWPVITEDTAFNFPAGNRLFDQNFTVVAESQLQGCRQVCSFFDFCLCRRKTPCWPA